MQLPPVRRLLVEDFKTEETWIGKLLYPLNQVFQALSTGLQNGITFQENIASQIQTVNFNYNTSELPIVFKLNKFSSTPIGIWIIKAKDTSTVPQALSGGVFPTDWEFDAVNNQIKINSISGLVSEQQYQLTMIII